MNECEHSETLVTRRTISGGSVQIVKQCTSCGSAVGSAMARSSVRSVDDLPAFDIARLERYDAQRRAEWAENRARFDLERATKTGEWWDQYREYIASPQWAALRRAALERDQFLCQGCRRCRAKEVHHLNYRRLGHELLFDLVSLCGPCHERAHEHADEAAEAGEDV